MDKKAGTGELSCKVCGQKFQTGINCKLHYHHKHSLIHTIRQRLIIVRPDLSAGVDVYSDWIDACDTVAKEAAGRDAGPHSYRDVASGAGGRRNSDTRMDRHLVTAMEDDEDGQGDYDDE